MAKNSVNTAIVVSADAKGAIEGFQLTQKELKALRKQTKKASKDSAEFKKKMKGVATAAAGMAAAAAAAATAIGVALVKSNLKSIDTLAKKADSINITTEALTKYRFAAEQSGSSGEKLDKAFEKLAKNVSEAAQGTGVAKRSLDQLGISAEKLNKLSPDKQFELISESMKGVKVSGDRVRIAYELMGKSGIDLINMLNAGSKGLKAYGEQAEMAGIAINRIDANKIEQANDAINLGSKIFKGFGQQLTVQVAPVLTATADKLFNIAVESGGVGEITTKAFNATVKAVGFFGDALLGIKVIYVGLAKHAQEFISIIVDTLVEADKAITDFLNGFTILGGDFKESANLKHYAQVYKDAATEAGNVYNETIDKIVEEGLPSEQIEEFVSDVTRATEEAAEKNVKLIKKQNKEAAAAYKKLGGDVEAVLTNITTSTADMANNTKEELMDIGGVFDNIFSGSIGTFKDLMDSVEDMFRNTVSKMAQNNLSGIFDGGSGGGGGAGGLGGAAAATGNPYITAAAIAITVGPLIKDQVKKGVDDYGKGRTALAAHGGIAALASMSTIFSGKYQQDRSSLRLGAEGGDFSGDIYSRQAKKKSFWRGSRYRYRSEDIDGEMATAISESLGGSKGAIVKAFNTLGGDITTAAFDGFTSELATLDLKGKSNEDIQEFVNTWLVAVGDELAQSASGMGMDELTGLATALTSVNSGFDLINKTLLSSSVGGGQIASALADYAGGLDQLSSATSGYFTNFFTEAEQYAELTEGLQESFSGLNIAMPQTRAGFRALVDGMDLTTKSNQEAYVSLLQLAPAMDGYLDGIEKEKQLKAQQWAQFASGIIGGNNAREAAAKEAAVIERGTFISTMLESVAELNEEFNSLFMAANDGGGIEGALHDLGVKSIPQTREEFAALVLGVKALGKVGFETQASLLKLVPQADEYYSQLEEEAEILKDLNKEEASRIASLRQNAFNGFADSIQDLNDRIITLRDDLYHTGDATSLLSEQQERYNQAQATASSISDFITGENLSDRSVLTGQQKVDLAQSRFLDLFERGLGGDVDAASQATGAASDVLGAARNQFASSADFTRIFKSTNRKLVQLQDFLSGVDAPSAGTVIDPTAQALADTLKEFSATTSLSIENVASAFDVNISDLTDKFGVDMSIVTEQLSLDLSVLPTGIKDKLSELGLATTDSIGELNVGLQEHLTVLIERLIEAVEDSIDTDKVA